MLKTKILYVFLNFPMSLSFHHLVSNHYHKSSWRMAYKRRGGGIIPSPLHLGMLTAESSSFMMEVRSISSITCLSDILSECLPTLIWFDKSMFTIYSRVRDKNGPYKKAEQLSRNCTGILSHHHQHLTKSQETCKFHFRSAASHENTFLYTMNF